MTFVIFILKELDVFFYNPLYDRLYAAEGTLIINDIIHLNPSGCYNSNSWPMTVGNSADVSANIYAAPRCTGGVIRVVYPDEYAIEEHGRSVRIT
ncbi:unnamed protein product [Cunninghamella echinulata]